MILMFIQKRDLLLLSILSLFPKLLMQVFIMG